MSTLRRLLRVWGLVPPGVRRWVPYWLVAGGVFTVGAVLGAAIGAERATPVLFPAREPGGPVPDVSAVGLFAHNARVAATMVVGGVLFTIPTLYMLLFNGFAFGSVMVDAAGTLGLVAALALVAPHGVLELPALWLAGAVPLRWLHVVWAITNGRDRAASVPRVAARTAVALAAAAVLLGAAAVVEATVTLRLARAL